VRPVGRGCLLLHGTWSHLWCIQRSVYAHSLICISYRAYEIDYCLLFLSFHATILILQQSSLLCQLVLSQLSPAFHEKREAMIKTSLPSKQMCMALYPWSAVWAHGERTFHLLNFDYSGDLMQATFNHQIYYFYFLRIASPLILWYLVIFWSWWYKSNTMPILMHQMCISSNYVSSVVLWPKKLEIRRQLWKL
jgi:hypothetical protein